MKNITVAVPDEIYRAARVRAAQQGRSVSSLVAEFLTSLEGEDELRDLLAEQEKLLDEMQRYGFSGADRVSREELYDRAVR